jgi:hypothetical protein
MQQGYIGVNHTYADKHMATRKLMKEEIKKVLISQGWQRS